MDYKLLYLRERAARLAAQDERWRDRVYAGRVVYDLRKELEAAKESLRLKDEGLARMSLRLTEALDLLNEQAPADTVIPEQDSVLPDFYQMSEEQRMQFFKNVKVKA